MIVDGGDGEVCVRSGSESAGCQSADGGTLEFEFSPGAVGVGEEFEVCNNGCVSHENGPEKAPERVNLGGGSGGSSSGDFGGNNVGQGGGGGGVNWEQLCIKYGDRIGISSDSCDQYAEGTQLTQAGEDFLKCKLITTVGPTLLGLDIAGIGVGSVLSKFLC